MNPETSTIEAETPVLEPVVEPLGQMATYYGWIAALRATADYNLHSAGATTD